ncbi:MAG TPA: GNAT family N-acetyltransferase [Anaerolineales bacterium]
MPTPIRLTPADAERYARLRMRMLTAMPGAFDASPQDDEALHPAWLARMLAEEYGAIFAIQAPGPPGLNRVGLNEASDAPKLIAAATITRAKQPQFAHRARIWGVFVEPPQRGKGLGRALLSAAIDLARSWVGVDFVDLSVSENAPEAQRLYESLRRPNMRAGGMTRFT